MESILRSCSPVRSDSRPDRLFRRSESSLAKMFPNISASMSREDRNRVQRIKAKRNRLKPNQTVSIDESPMMLLPKAKIRNDYNQLARRTNNVISADDTSGLHLSTIPGSAIVSKSLTRPTLRNHHHSSRSDVDSGIGSMKRSVTFDEISLGRSSFKSIDDIDALSDITQHECNKNLDQASYEAFPEGRYDKMPTHFDTYSDNSYSVPKVKQRKISVNTSNENIDENHEKTCPICSGLSSETERIQKHFGGVDAFFKWFWSRWGKRADASRLQRRNQGFQGSRPRFCNIVKSLQLHSREGRDISPCTGDSGFDEFDFITRDGRLINRWRKDSGTSYEDDMSEVFEPVAGLHARNALEMWLSIGEDEFGNRVNFRPNLTFGLFSSIPEQPESKQDDTSKGPGSGLDGKPGTPTSVDEDLDRMDLSNLNKDKNDQDIELVPPVVVVERILDDDKDPQKNKKESKPPSTQNIDLKDQETNTVNDTPIQPPPTPEILTPREQVIEKPATPTPTPPKKRTCITKKTLERKPISRPKKKEEMEKPAEEPLRESTPPPPPPVVEEKKEPEIKVNLPEPALPEVKEPSNKKKKEKLKPEKFAIAKPEKSKTEDDTLFDDNLTNHLKKFELMVSDMNTQEETPRKHTNKPLKITGRLALSQQSSRFTLPMDMKELETMSAKDYVVNYCKITKRRQHLYDNVYRQAVGGNAAKPIPYKDLEKALKNVLVDTLNNEHFKYILDLLEIKEGEEINVDLFSKMAALAERLLYPQYVSNLLD